MKAENKKFKLTGKTFLCVFLSLTLMTCGVPFAFANDTANSGATQEDVQATSDALGTAIKSEISAGQIIAAANDVLANGALDVAVSAQKAGETAIDYSANVAQDAEAKAEAEQSRAEADAVNAAEARQNAAEALEQATDAKVAIAEAQAALAKEAANDATKDAVDAYNAMLDAYTQAQVAKLAYETAQKTYDDTCKAIDEELQAGLILAEEAAKQTEAAKEEAEALYAELLEKQAAAKEAAKKALEEKEVADAKLKKDIEDLADIVLNNAEIVATKTAVTAATGVALAAAQIAVEIAEKTYESLEGDIDEAKKNVEELEKAAEPLRQAITDAETVVNNATEADKAAKQAVTDAQAALYLVEQAKKNADAILKLKIEDAEKANVEAAQKDISDGKYDAADVKLVTEHVVKNIADYASYYEGDTVSSSSINWVTDGYDKEQLVFSITKKVKSGKKTKDVTYYYEAEVVHGVVQIVEAEKGNLAAKTLEEVKAAVATDETLSFKGLIKSYDIYAKNGNLYVKVPFLGEQQITVDDDGNFCILGGDKGTVSYTDRIVYDTSGSEAIMNANVITNLWAAAANSEAEYTKKSEELTAAQEAAKKAAEELTAAQEALKKAQEDPDLAALETQIKEAQGNLEELEEEYYGGFSDKLICLLLADENGTYESILEQATTEPLKFAALLLKYGLGMAPAEETAALDNLFALLKDSDDLADELSKAYSTVTNATSIVSAFKDGSFDMNGDGEISIDDLTYLKDTLDGFDLAPNTWKTILKWIEKKCEDKHNAALDDLQTAVEQAEAAVLEQGKLILADTEEAAKKEALYLLAAAEETVINAATELAKQSKDNCTQAAIDAKAAYEAYQSLVEKGLKPDDTRLIEAKQAWEDAEKSADAAKEEWQKAKESAIEAIKDAIKTLQEVDKAYNKPYAINVDGGTATVTYVPVHSSCILEFANSVKADTSDFFGLLGAEECASIGAIALMVQVDQLAESASLEGNDTDEQKATETEETEELGLTATLGSRVLLRANEAPEGKMFDKWVTEGVVLDDANSSTTTFTMPENDITITATYKNKDTEVSAIQAAFTIPNTGDPVSLVPFAAAAAVAIALAGFALFSLRRRHE